MTGSRSQGVPGRRAGRGDRRGAALMMALAALIIIGALGTSLAMAVMRNVSSTRRRASRDEMLNSAESGVEFVMSALARGSREFAGKPQMKPVEVPGPPCSVAVKSEAEGVYEITSRAARHGRSLGVRVTVRRARDGRFRLVSWEQLP